jgi:hypothetical protein
MMNIETPLAVWDTRDDGWFMHHAKASAWAQRHLSDANSIYRIEFHQDNDAPFAIVYRFTRDGAGRIVYDAELDGPARDKPVREPLDELPPENLLTMGVTTP